MNGTAFIVQVGEQGVGLSTRMAISSENLEL